MGNYSKFLGLQVRPRIITLDSGDRYRLTFYNEVFDLHTVNGSSFFSRSSLNDFIRCIDKLLMFFGVFLACLDNLIPGEFAYATFSDSSIFCFLKSASSSELTVYSEKTS